MLRLIAMRAREAYGKVQQHYALSSRAARDLLTTQTQALAGFRSVMTALLAGMGVLGLAICVMVYRERLSLIRRRGAEEALRTSDERFRSLVENMRGVVFSRHEMGAGVSLWGADVEAIAGSEDRQHVDATFWYSILHEDDRDRYLEAERRRKNDNTPYAMEYRITHPRTREVKWVRETGWNIVNPSTGRVFWDSHIVDVSDAKRSEQILRAIVEGVAGEVGADFLHSLVRHLATGLGVHAVQIGELVGTRWDRIGTVAVYRDGTRVPNYEYSLADTPCGSVVGRETCVYPRGVQGLFPDDEQLALGGIESYIGCPLSGASGKPLGLLAALDVKPIDQPEFVESMLRVFAARAAAELERQRAAEGLRLAKTVYETATEAILITDDENRIKAVNPAFARMTGYSPDEVIGKDPSVLNSGIHRTEFFSEMWRGLAESNHWEGEIWNRRKDGSVFPAWISVGAIDDDRGRREYVAMFSDITARKEDEERIRYQANYDALTGLPNRSLFLDRLGLAMAQARRSQSHVGLMYIDLDDFKLVNDTLGHEVGDTLLQQASLRLRAAVREADTVARLGGDEFTIILQDIARGEDAAGVASQVVESLSRPYVLDGQEAFVGASIGITVYPDDAGDTTTMLRNADMAMYRAKAQGRNRYQFFTPEMNAHAVNRMGLKSDLPHALDRKEFSLLFQPVVDLASGTVVAGEALLRWHHPNRGIIRPDEFIALAEETGVIAPLGEWVLAEACRTAAIWNRDSQSPVGIAVNVSGRQLRRGRFVEFVSRTLQETGLRAESLTLEIAETAVLGDGTEVIERLNELRSLGVSIAIDDFGTGYSSLGVLRKLPVDTLKIDRSFIGDITTDQGDAALTEAIIALAGRLALNVVAEGVETTAHLEMLEIWGCDRAQGHLFSTPVAADAFLDASGNCRPGALQSVPVRKG